MEVWLDARGSHFATAPGLNVKTAPQAFDYFRPQMSADADLLVGFLDFLIHAKMCDGYSFVFVPQLGKDQGHPVKRHRFRKQIPEETRKECISNTTDFDIAIPGSRVFRRYRSEARYGLYFSSIASAYDINIGAICLVSQKVMSKRELYFLLNAFEGLISLRKKAVALTHHEEFLRIDQNVRSSLDHAVGTIVHKSVSPNETLIFAPDKSKSRLDVTYSSREVTFSVPNGSDPVSWCFRTRQIIVINDTNDKSSISANAGVDFFNREFITYGKFLSCLYVPVFQGDECYCVIACYFARKNAVSSTESEILKMTARVLGDYYRLWTERNILQERIKENERIYRLVRQSLLIADIMHDAIADLITARGQIDMVTARTDMESRAISAAKASLKELINASRHFQSFFGKKSGVQNEEKDVFAPIRTISPGATFDVVNTHDIVDEIAQKYESILSKHKITLKNSCSVEFEGIKYNIKRALDNAVKNSIAHLQDKTHVRREITIADRIIASGVKSGFPEEHVEIAIVDNGRGVEPEYLSRVTEPFFSLRGGMGLGLPIIQAACEAHGGRIDIASRWGRDFEVTMSIPIRK
jgi:signal transduction histidine kinase